VQVEERLVVATVVEGSAALPPPLAAAAAIEEERTVMETITPEVTSEPLARASMGSEDVVMLPADDGLVPPPPTGERDAATSMMPESSTTVGVVSVEGAVDLSSCRYVDFPASGLLTSMLPNYRVTTGRCWRW
jgi:hypothetical protein